MTGTVHCHLRESYLHRGDSLSLDVKPANPQGHSILSSIRISEALDYSHLKVAQVIKPAFPLS